MGTWTCRRTKSDRPRWVSGVLMISLPSVAAIGILSRVMGSTLLCTRHGLFQAEVELASARRRVVALQQQVRTLQQEVRRAFKDPL
jgi:hypothetical protein